MNKRSREILYQLISKNEYGQTVSINELAEKFQVSSRTIRNDMIQINDYMFENGLQPVKFGKQGVILTESDIRRARETLKKEGFYSFKLTRNDRVTFAAVMLICSDCYITLNDLAEHMFVSRSTVIQDLDSLKTFFQKNNLYLFSHSNKGLLLEGRESDKRLLLMKLIQSVNGIFSDQPVRQHMTDCLSDKLKVDLDDRKTIEKIINEAEHAYGRFLTDRSFVELRDYLEFSFYRMKEGHVIETAGAQNSKWDMAAGMMHQLHHFFGVNVTESEIYFLTVILNRLKYIKKTTSNKEIVKMQVITRSFIESISNDLGIQFQGDYIFYENLINHLEPAFSTTVKEYDISSVVNQVLIKYPEVVKATKRNVYIFEEYMGRELSEDEVAYIVVHICASIERHKNNSVRHSVILVCNGGIGTSQLLLARLEKFFRLNVLDIISAHDIINTNTEEADVIISTVSLDKWNVDYIQVDPLLTDEDCIRVGEKLSKIRPKESVSTEETNQEIAAYKTLGKIKDILEEGLEEKETLVRVRNMVETFFRNQKQKLLIDFLSEENIRLSVECKDWEEAIRESASYLLKKGSVELRYVEAMIQNVKENGPYIVLAPGFAMPHEALNAGAKEVGMSLIRLSNPVPFGKEQFDPVEWVCCLSAIDKEIHLKAMFHLINLFHNPDFRKEAALANTGKEVYQLIEKYEYEMR